MLMPRARSADRLPTATLVNCWTFLANLFNEKGKKKAKNGAEEKWLLGATGINSTRSTALPDHLCDSRELSEPVLPSAGFAL